MAYLAPVRPVRPRVISIDVLRGVTVAFMIVVNTAGDGNASYAQLQHSSWNGCTLTDLVFPTFLFVMGVSMAISRSSGNRMPRKTSSHLGKATRRSLILIFIGLFLNLLPFFNLGTLRYCGVLQRIGITYWLAAVCLLFFDWPGGATICALILVGYWALMTLVPVPGFGKTGLELGVLNPAGNLATALDRMVIPTAHIYHHTFYDPEGLLSTLPALCSVLLGVIAWWFVEKRTLKSQLALMALGIVLAGLGFAWNPAFPINKRLWTSSYVLWVAGIDFVILALLSWYLDDRGTSCSGWLRSSLTPWLALGSNALAAYVLSEVLASLIVGVHLRRGITLQQWSYLQIPDWAGSPSLRSLEWSLAFTALCYLPIHLLHRKRILIKL
jgi:predicted acyltransferase